MNLRKNIAVGNFRKGGLKLPPEYIEIKIDRTNEILGNPFKMLDDSQAERARVVEQYRVYLLEQFKQRSSVFLECVKMAQRLEQGHRIGLYCWCAPKACHGDVLRRAIIYLTTPDGKKRYQTTKA